MFTVSSTLIDLYEQFLQVKQVGFVTLGFGTGGLPRAVLLYHGTVVLMGCKPVIWKPTITGLNRPEMTYENVLSVTLSN